MAALLFFGIAGQVKVEENRMLIGRGAVPHYQLMHI